MSPAVSTATDHLLPLDRLAAGAKGVVRRVSGDTPVRRRLMEMGLCQGVVVEVLRRAPLGDPIELGLRGYLLSLRRDQAMLVEVGPLMEAGSGSPEVRKSGSPAASDDSG